MSAQQHGEPCMCAAMAMLATPRFPPDAYALVGTLVVATFADFDGIKRAGMLDPIIAPRGTYPKRAKGKPLPGSGPKARKGKDGAP